MQADPCAKQIAGESKAIFVLAQKTQRAKAAQVTLDSLWRLARIELHPYLADQRFLCLRIESVVVC